MYQYLTARGVPADRILQEDRSTSTRENLRFSKELLIENGYMPKEIALVTNEFHELRAGMIAKDCGWTVSSIPAGTQPWLIPTYWVREWLSKWTFTRRWTKCGSGWASCIMLYWERNRLFITPNTIRRRFR